MKRCPVCDLLNLDEALRCTSCSSPLPRGKKGYFQIIRWHLLALLLVLAMMALLKYRGGEIFLDFSRIMKKSSPGQVEISTVRIYHDLTGKTIVEGKLINISDKSFSNLTLGVTVYDGQDKKLAHLDHPLPELPKGQFVPFQIKFSSDKNIDRAHFILNTEDKKELYLLNRPSTAELNGG